MVKRSVIAIVAIIAVAGLIFAAFGGTGKGEDNKSTYNSSNQEQQTNQKNSSINSNTTVKTGISANEAQEIAQNYIKSPGAKAGTPKLIKIKGNEVYAVPVIENGQKVGEIDIDAQTGQNVGGAGGP